MQSLTMQKILKVDGTVRLPGSKSLSNRALLLAALSKGKTKLVNLLDSDDIRHMLNALTSLGVKYQLSSCKTECEVEGLAGKFISDQPIELFLGNAGTAMRPLCAALAFSEVDATLTGEPRMEERPIGDLSDVLIDAGAKIEYLKNKGFPPLRITHSPINADKFCIDGSVSSQFLSALLMAAPLLQRPVEIEIIGELVSIPYIDITLDIMARFGVSVTNHAYKRFSISGDSHYTSPGEFWVEGDASSASYFLAAGAIGGGTVRVEGVGKTSVQGDKAFADVLAKMGAHISWGDNFIEASAAPLKGVDLDFNHIPDAAMTIATTALFAQGSTVIRNVYNWRVKETDRLAAMATELQKVGAIVEEGRDYIAITPPQQIQHAAIDTYNDHRIAMCFSLLAFSDASVTINDPACTSKTFPEYFEALSSISSR